ncbi:unnamed protein product [Hapterophycus canaliculatus]
MCLGGGHDSVVLFDLNVFCVMRAASTRFKPVLLWRCESSSAIRVSKHASNPSTREEKTKQVHKVCMCVCVHLMKQKYLWVIRSCTGKFQYDGNLRIRSPHC